jgi:hypothetical protein
MGQLRESHADPLVPAGEAAQVPIRVIARNTFLKLGVRDKIHQLRENHPALIHTPTVSSSNRSRSVVPQHVVNGRLTLKAKN